MIELLRVKLPFATVHRPFEVAIVKLELEPDRVYVASVWCDHVPYEMRPPLFPPVACRERGIRRKSTSALKGITILSNQNPGFILTVLVGLGALLGAEVGNGLGAVGCAYFGGYSIPLEGHEPGVGASTTLQRGSDSEQLGANISTGPTDQHKRSINDRPPSSRRFS